MILLDGAMGTMLQQAGMPAGVHPEYWGMQNPGVVQGIHTQYIDAGSRIIYANTFGANEKKLAGAPAPQKDLIAAAIATARAAAQGRAYVALDVGPIGELLEPLGPLSFDEAYDIYARMCVIGAEAGADLVMFETFTDLYEMKAAVLAARENTTLPVWSTMTFETTGRTFTGCTVEAMALTLSALGVDALGFNCSVGPGEMLPLARRLAEWTNLPLIIKPNAGLPDPKTGKFGLLPDDFGAGMEAFADIPVAAMGGCCGTSPAYIRALAARVRGEQDIGQFGLRPPRRTNTPRRGVCTPGVVCEFGGVRVVGERLNPTGKKRFAQALREHDMQHIRHTALEQAESGADILDVNVGVPGADEPALMREVVRAVQATVRLPLQIDSANPAAIEAGLRALNGRGIVNSVTADDARLDAILPLVKKYGAAVIGLALDESGMPKTAQERIAKAEYIVRRALEHGIPREDIIIDCLTLTVSAQQDQARHTLEAVRHMHSQGLHCALGVSNISFGLPARGIVTQSFLTQAMLCGLDFPIINPNAPGMMDAVHAFRVLSGEDAQCAAYVARYAGSEAQALTVGPKAAAAGPAAPAQDAGPGAALRTAVQKGLGDDAAELTRGLLADTDPLEVINAMLIPALDTVGELYEKQVLFLPQLISAANAAGAAFDVLKAHMKATGQQASRPGRIVLATVKGDVHDIGKNIVRVILENYGWQTTDLGRDVAPEVIVQTVQQEHAGLLGLSALMTTTLPAMQTTIAAMRSAAPECKIMVGGAVLTEQYAKEIGADYYAKDAKTAAAIAKEVFG